MDGENEQEQTGVKGRKSTYLLWVGGSPLLLLMICEDSENFIKIFFQLRQNLFVLMYAGAIIINFWLQISSCFS